LFTSPVGAGRLQVSAAHCGRLRIDWKHPEKHAFYQSLSTAVTARACYEVQL